MTKPFFPHKEKQLVKNWNLVDNCNAVHFYLHLCDDMGHSFCVNFRVALQLLGTKIICATELFPFSHHTIRSHSLISVCVFVKITSSDLMLP